MANNKCYKHAMNSARKASESTSIIVFARLFYFMMSTRIMKIDMKMKENKKIKRRIYPNLFMYVLWIIKTLE